LTGCAVIYATVGETVACAIEYQDENLNIIFIDNNANASYLTSNSSVVYTHVSSDPVDIK